MLEDQQVSLLSLKNLLTSAKNYEVLVVILDIMNNTMHGLMIMF